MSDEQPNMIRDKHGKIITINEIQWVSQQHNLGEVTRVVGVLKGRANVPILIETEKGKYVLRYLTESMPIERIKFIEDMLLCLKEASIPVVNAIKNESNEYFSIKNHRMVQVYPYIEGTRFEFRPEYIKSNACMLSNFHTALSKFKPGPLPDKSICPTEENLQNRLHQLYQHKDTISQTSLEKVNFLYNTLFELWNQVDQHRLLDTIIHDDWHPWNLIYSEEGEVKCILDFDYVRPGKRIYDVAYCLYWIYMRSSNDMRQNNLKMFIEGYKGLTSEEKNILPLVLAKVGLFFIIESVSTLEKQLKVNEPFIEFFVSQEGKEYLL